MRHVNDALWRVSNLLCPLALNHRITAWIRKALGLSHSSKSKGGVITPIIAPLDPASQPCTCIPFCSRHHAFKSDAVPVHRVSGMQWLVVVRGYHRPLLSSYHSHLPFLPQFCGLVNLTVQILQNPSFRVFLRYQNFRKGVVLVDYTHGKIELPSQKGGAGGCLYRFRSKIPAPPPPPPPPLWIQPWSYQHWHCFCDCFVCYIEVWGIRTSRAY